MISHEIMGGKVHVYRRDTNTVWQCATYLKGRNHRISTKREGLEQAKQFAEDWYLGLRGKEKAGILLTEKTFKFAADRFTLEYGLITEGQRSLRWVQGHEIRLRVHLLPFFGNIGLSQITPGKVQDYRVHRMKTNRVVNLRSKSNRPVKDKPPARSTLHDEVVTLRLVLKTGIRHGWLDHLPDLSPPYKTQGKIVHRPWFSPAEYKQFYEATREYAKHPPQPQYQWNAEQVHDYVLFMGNTGMRPDEVRNLQHRDVTVTTDHGSGQEILEIDVRGKRGVGFCKSMPGAVRPYQRLLHRPKPKRGKQLRNRSRLNPNPVLSDIMPEPTDKVFPGNYVKLFNRILDETNLKLDRDGNPRTAYSLRHTYICLRLMEGADIYQIAKNCRTSVEMIEKYYAAHIKNTLDASAINVMRPKGAKAAKVAKARQTVGTGQQHAPPVKLTEDEKTARKARARTATQRNGSDPTDL
jgi:integrase